MPFPPFVLETHKILLILQLTLVSVCATQIASLETISKLWVPWIGGSGSEQQNQGISPCHTRSADKLLLHVVVLPCSAVSIMVSYS
jgi:hypothetical protein